MNKRFLWLLLLIPALVFATKVRLWDGKTAYALLDLATHALFTVDYAHHEIHSGSHFNVSGWQSLDSGDTTLFAVKTPNTTKWGHMLFDITGSLITEVKVFEDATVTVGDTITPWNNNRNSAKTSVVTVISGPTVSITGTCIDSSKVGAGGGSKFGGTISREDETILKQNSTYLYMIISGSNTNYVNFRGKWYEHTNKN